MDIKKLQALVVDALEDVKAQDIKVFDTVHLTSLFAVSYTHLTLPTTPYV